MSENTLDRKDLKIMAYKEKVAELLEVNADLRVDLTILSQQLAEANEKIAAFEEPKPDVPTED